MLPLDLRWYRRLIGAAVGLGIAGGVLSLVYLTGTGALIDRVFGSADGTLWSGQWWWVPLTAAGAVIVVWLRGAWGVVEHVPGGVQIIEAGKIDHSSGAKWVGLAIISAVTGASLGPSFALAVMGGSLGSWLADYRWPEDEANQDYTLTGVAAGFGAAFTSPILAAFIVTELAPTPRARYVAAIIPQLIAATMGFIIYFSVLGRTFLGVYELPNYEFKVLDMATAVALGVVSAVIMATLVLVVLAVKRLAQIITNRYFLAALGGAVVGILGMALPLTLGAGQGQLETVVGSMSAWGVGFLSVVLIAKMFALALSLQIGFLGGNVFPMIFIGGLSGVIVHLLIPAIPAALAVSCMLAAVPGSYLRAPIGMTFIAAVAVALDPRTTAPVAVAVITSYLLVSTVRYLLAKRRENMAGAATA
jgi:H+/Cl- antiporter ClcA